MKMLFITVLLAVPIGRVSRAESKQRVDYIAESSYHQAPSLLHPGFDESGQSQASHKSPNNKPNDDAKRQCALIIVTAVTGAFIAWQAWETKKAAVATQTYVEIQEASLTQWIELKKWTAFRRAPAHGGKVLCIGCDIFNPTERPLKIEKMEIGCRGLIQTSQEGEFSLPPDTPYLIATSVDLSDQEYIQQTLVIPIRITVWFNNILKKPQDQTFAGTLKHEVGNDDITEFVLRADMVQAYQDSKKQKNPS